MKKIHLKMKLPGWLQHFSLYKSMGIFSNAQGQVTQVPGRILPIFEPLPDFMSFLAVCKNEEDPIKYEGARVVIS